MSYSVMAAADSDNELDRRGRLVMQVRQFLFCGACEESVAVERGDDATALDLDAILAAVADHEMVCEPVILAP